MKFSTLLGCTGIIGLLFGLLFLLAPAAGLAQYGATTDGTGLFMARFFGAALCYAGLVLLALRTARLEHVRPVALAACLGEVAGCVVAIQLQLSGTVNALGWSSVALYGVLALLFGAFAARDQPVL